MLGVNDEILKQCKLFKTAIHNAAKQMNIIYGNITRDRAKIIRHFSSKTSSELPINETIKPSVTIPENATIAQEKTRCAIVHAASGDSFSRVSIKIGINDDANAPSPKRRRNKFGIVNAITNADI